MKDMLIEVMGASYDEKGTIIKGMETGNQHRMVELRVAQKIDLPNDPTGVRMGISNPAIENTSAGHISVSSDHVGVVPPSSSNEQTSHYPIPQPHGTSRSDIHRAL